MIIDLKKDMIATKTSDDLREEETCGICGYTDFFGELDKHTALHQGPPSRGRTRRKPPRKLRFCPFGDYIT